MQSNRKHFIARTLHASLLCPSACPLATHPLLSELKDAGFNIQKRGQIEVKGKGQMNTYFLLGNLLVSEDSIMGRNCLHTEDSQCQSNQGNEPNDENYKKGRLSPGLHGGTDSRM